MFARVVAGQVVSTAPAAAMPGYEPTGWFPVSETTRPADTATDTTDPGWSVGPTTVTRTWTPRPWTPAELDARARQAQREAGRAAIVAQALVWLAADSAQAATRAGQITQAIADIDAQITSVTAYTFAGSNVTGINASLNSALKPQIVAMLQKLRGAAVMLDELNAMRDRHNDALSWIGRTIT